MERDGGCRYGEGEGEGSDGLSVCEYTYLGYGIHLCTLVLSTGLAVHRRVWFCLSGAWLLKTVSQ